MKRRNLLGLLSVIPFAGPALSSTAEPADEWESDVCVIVIISALNHHIHIKCKYYTTKHTIHKTLIINNIVIAKEHLYKIKL